MNKVFQITALLALVTLGFSSCRVFQGSTVNCSPDPMEVHADSIRYEVKASVPPKSGMKKGGTYIGEAKIDGVSQGKIVFSSDKYPNVKKTGIDTTLKFKRPYMDKMNGNNLLIKQNYERKGKTFELPDIEDLCGCCITTSREVYEGSYLIFSEHNYQKEVKADRKARFDFPKDVWAIQEGDYNKADIKAIGDFLAQKYITQKVVIEGFASPEGPYKRNVELSVNRSKEVRTWLTEQLKAAGYDNYLDSTFFDIRVTNADWDGFKASVQSQSYSQDVKNQIITLVSSGLQPDNLEKQIMALVGGKDKVEHILAPLRRATIKMDGFQKRRTDAEIDKLASDFCHGSFSGNLKNDFEKEEWLYAISRMKKTGWKKQLLEAFRDAYPADPRAFNDLGVIGLLEGNLDAGMNYLEKAYKLKTTDHAIQNNLGVAYLKNGKYRDAKSSLESSLAAMGTSEANFNLGVVLEKMAQYNRAVEKFGSSTDMAGATYNAGLCKLLLGDLNGAKTSLREAIRQDPNDAKAYYVLAVVGARSKDASIMGSNLKKACDLDSAMKNKARKDLEFRNYYTNTEFTAATR